MKSANEKRLYPEDYVVDVTKIVNEACDFSNTIYEMIDNDIRKLDRVIFNEPENHYNADRLPQIHHGTKHNYTFIQPEFPNYNAGKIQIGKSDTEFDVLAEGPKSVQQLNNLLGSLQRLGINVLIPVGHPAEKDKLKFFNYISEAKPIDVSEFLKNATTDSQPPAFPNLSFKFYRFDSENNGQFFILHVSTWLDHGLPVMTQADKAFLGHYFQFSKNACFHCSAGIGRSACMLLTKMSYRTIFMEENYLNFSTEQLRDNFTGILRQVKTVKPVAASDGYQVLIVLGLAEDVQLAYKSWQLGFGDKPTISGLLQNFGMHPLEKSSEALTTNQTHSCSIS